MDRVQLQKKLNDEYQKLTTYKEKMAFLYYIIIQSQKYRLEYMGQEGIINLDELLKKVSSVTNDDEFADLLEVEVLRKLNLGHMHITPVEEKLNLDELPLDLKEKKQAYDAKANTFYEVNGSTMIITIPSFSRVHFVKEKEQNTYKNIKTSLMENDIQNIIIDIRGNGGGTDEYFELLFPIISDKDLIVNNSFRNLFTNQNEDHSYVVKGNPDNKKYSIYLLVDNKVFSTAEGFARCCKDNSLATLIGTPTLGEGFGMTPLEIMLSDKEYNGAYKKDYVKICGLKMTFPIEAPINEFKAIDYAHFYNTVPDIICDPNLSMDVALGLIKENKMSI